MLGYNAPVLAHESSAALGCIKGMLDRTVALLHVAAQPQGGPQAGNTAGASECSFEGAAVVMHEQHVHMNRHLVLSRWLPVHTASI